MVKLRQPVAVLARFHRNVHKTSSCPTDSLEKHPSVDNVVSDHRTGGWLHHYHVCFQVSCREAFSYFPMRCADGRTYRCCHHNSCLVNNCDSLSQYCIILWFLNLYNISHSFNYSLPVMSSLLSMSSNIAILSNVCKSGWDTLVHHLLTVAGFLPNSSASHFAVRFFSTSTNLMRF